MKLVRLGLLVTSAFTSSLTASGAEAKLPTAEAFSKGILEEYRDSKPQVLWQWMNGHISKEGITADLEAMSKNGISGAIIDGASAVTIFLVGFGAAQIALTVATRYTARGA